MANTITIPDFDFSGFYYGEILDRLIQYKRVNVPELTDESPYDPFMQLTRMMALVGHLNNVLIDLVANESTLPTSKLVETVRNMLRLIGYEMSPASPAQVDLIYELSKVLAVNTIAIPANSQAATKQEGDVPSVYFEALEELEVVRTDLFGHVYGCDGGAYTDYTAKANSTSHPADDWSPWTTPESKDAVYFGHDNAMWCVTSIGVASAASGITGVWEFYDGEWRKAAPTSVTQVGGQLEHDLSSLLGSSNRQGTLVRVQLNETTAFEDVYSTWDGSKNIATTGLLGQTTPTTDAALYTVGSDWTEFNWATDGSAGLTTDGQLAYTVPQTLTRNWIHGTVNGVESYWIRFRIITVSAPTAPVIERVRMDEGRQYVQRVGVQGRAASETIGSSSGAPNQSFTTAKDHFVWGSETVYADGELWTRVSNFLNSASTDKHYTVELGANERASIVFGDGVSGRIPTLGTNNITGTYRYGADTDGNVGSNTVTIDKSGLSYVSSVFNPRNASGWSQAEGSTEASLERAKANGPASLRVKEVALSPDDAITLAIAYTDENSSQPYSRAKAFEEGYGPKTVELIVVAKGGGLASNDQLTALQDYFNGNRSVYPVIAKHFVANQEVVCVNYTPKVIDIAATIVGDVVAETVENMLRQIIQPEAVKEDGTTYLWEFGAEIPKTRLEHEIYSLDPGIQKVTITTPSSDVVLQPRELPKIGTVTLTIVAP